MKNNNSTDFYNRVSPINSFSLDIIGSYLLITLLVGIVLNTLLLHKFKKYKDLQTPINTFIIAYLDTSSFDLMLIYVMEVLKNWRLLG